jgi:hypothetical protein
MNRYDEITRKTVFILSMPGSYVYECRLDHACRHTDHLL